MFIDSAKFNCGSSGAECCHRRHTSRSAGARPEGVTAAITFGPSGTKHIQVTYTITQLPYCDVVSRLSRVL